MSDYTRLANEYTEYRKRAYEKYAIDAEAIKQLEAENKRMRDAYNGIFGNYIPLADIDEANNKLLLLLEPDEQMGRDMLKAHPLKGGK